MFFTMSFWRCVFLDVTLAADVLAWFTQQRDHAKSTHIRQTFGNSLLPQPFWMLWFPSHGFSYIHYPCFQQVCLFSDPMKKAATEGESVYIIYSLFLQEDKERRNQKRQVLLTWTSEKKVDGSKMWQIKPVEVATAKGCILMERRNSVTVLVFLRWAQLFWKLFD